jgi:putative Ca2+/H+ antiporter (TMEM165/GDT1 family)
VEIAAEAVLASPLGEGIARASARHAAGSHMDTKLFAMVFGSVFLAELGDKTQLATMLFVSESANPRLVVFCASALALVVTSALGVLGGAALAQVVSPRALSVAAGVGFIAIGAWTLARAVAGS